MERAVARITDVGDFFARYVDGTDSLPYQELFGAAGVAFATAARDVDRPFLGARLATREGALVVESVIRGAAGMEAGLLPNDEVLALGGDRVPTEAALQNALRGVGMGETAELLVSRAGILRTLSLTGRADPRPLVSLAIEGDSELRRVWLGREE